MTQFHYSSNYPLLAREFGDDLGVLPSALLDDEDLIPILDREDNSDLSRPDSSRCSSLSIPLSEWTCPLKDSFPSCSHLFENVTHQLPRAPPPTPLPTSPNFLPRSQNGLHLEVPSFSLDTSLTELGVFAAMGNPVFIRRPSWDLNVEENLTCSTGQVFKVGWHIKILSNTLLLTQPFPERPRIMGFPLHILRCSWFPQPNASNFQQSEVSLQRRT